MNILIGIEFDYPPSINHAYMQLKGGKKVLHPQYFMYREVVAYKTANAVQLQGCPRPPLILVVGVYKPDRKKRDLDNILKVLQDGISLGLRIDDSLITTVVISHLGIVKGGKVLVNIGQDDNSIIHLPQLQSRHNTLTRTTR